MSLFSTILGTAAKVGAGLLGASSAKKANTKEYERQKEFAQSGIQWKVADAKAAGINPIAAIGASGASYQPTVVSGPSPLQSVFENVGQGLDRAAAAGKTRTQRDGGIIRRQQELTVENMQLQNDFLRTKIALVKQPGSPPGMPSNALLNANGGQGDVESLITTQPLERTAGHPSIRGAEPGSLPEVGWSRTPDGGYAILPSKDTKERIEDVMPLELGWAMRNLVLPSFGKNQAPPFKAPKGKEWTYDFMRQAYYLRPARGRDDNSLIDLRRPDGRPLFRLRKVR